MNIKNLFRAPAWCNSTLIKRQDVLAIKEFYVHFNTPIRSGMSKLFAKVDNDPFYEPTLFDQVVFVRCLLSDIASMQEVFEEEIWSEVAVECADQLRLANKFDKI